MSIAAFVRRHPRPIGVTLLALVAVAWIASGVITREPPEAPEAVGSEPMTVAVEERRAERVERIVALQGDVEPHQRIQVRAETAGQVAEWDVQLGADLDQGERMARLRMDDREAKRQEAIARLRDRQSERDATARLVEDGAAPPIQLDAREAEVAAARARLEAIELDIENTRIRSPIEGSLNRRIAEQGDFVSVGDPIAEVVDNDPLLGVVQVPQHQIERIEPGQSARLRFLDGRRADGRVTFVSRVARPGTRTFRVEVEVPNPGRALPSGISAEVEIPTEEVDAHKVSAAVISLDDAGRVGAKTVDADNQVVFHPIEVIRTAPDGVWVTGLPERIRLITVGQDFVSAGERVRPRTAEGEMLPARSDGAGDS
ncbi:efflux RND transporter periplasmic adaptor subunit [Halofilum ochraceum]|uniref:efflux RND transporter periplasmic adaptor subunit n=1 Tax=Halofilum ochraceum TaxID=1611323 RepID=UPI001FE0310C|nr:efflux RND transporter periplasmic adaptor subunit [Halofilum ochraceum]